MATPGGAALGAGAWIAKHRIELRFSVPASSETLTPEIEVERAKVAFTGVPTATGTATTGGKAAIVVGGLHDGRYHWQARLRGASGTSAWVPFASRKFDFGADTRPPDAPLITSPTDPDHSRPYNTHNVVLQWLSKDKGSGIRGYVYGVSQGTPTLGGTPAAARGATFSTLGNGIWRFGVRAVDKAGNLSPISTFQVTIDRTRPAVHAVGNAVRSSGGPISFKFLVTKSAQVRVNIFKVGTKRPVGSKTLRVAGHTVTALSWGDKKASPGRYFASIQAVDSAGNTARNHFPLLTIAAPKAAVPVAAPVVGTSVGGKHIVISLSRETLYAYDGSHLYLQTYVTTGNPSLPTPIGSFAIMAKLHPFEFISPWPVGSPYWYPPSWTQFAMLFRGGGYYIHDAPWRTSYGPGTNGPGQPGTNYGGTHGCVNVPPSSMLALWNWTPIGTPVQVVP